MCDQVKQKYWPLNTWYYHKNHDSKICEIGKTTWAGQKSVSVYSKCVCVLSESITIV